MSGPRCVIVGLGNSYRGDDQAGLKVAERLRGRVGAGTAVRTLEGDPTPLLEILANAQLVMLVDAVASDAEPGTLYRFDASRETVPGSVFGSSTHAFGISETIELARVLGRLKARVLVYGIAGADFSSGEELSAPVEAAVEALVETMLEGVEQCMNEP